MYKLKLNLPNSSRDQVVELDGVGRFTNGRIRKVSDEEAKKLKAFTHMEGIELIEVEDDTTGSKPEDKNQDAPPAEVTDQSTDDKSEDKKES